MAQEASMDLLSSCFLRNVEPLYVDGFFLHPLPWSYFHYVRLISVVIIIIVTCIAIHGIWGPWRITWFVAPSRRWVVYGRSCVAIVTLALVGGLFSVVGTALVPITFVLRLFTPISIVIVTVLLVWERLLWVSISSVRLLNLSTLRVPGVHIRPGDRWLMWGRVLNGMRYIVSWWWTAVVWLIVGLFSSATQVKQYNRHNDVDDATSAEQNHRVRSFDEVAKPRQLSWDVSIPSTYKYGKYTWNRGMMTGEHSI